MNPQKYNFDYLSEKISNAKFINEPFKHLYIENFFSPEHFDEIINSAEIRCSPASNDEELINNLCLSGFKPIGFPGCVVDKDVYINWHNKKDSIEHNPACEGAGMAFRLYDFQSEILKQLSQYVADSYFNKVIAEKFNINFQNCIIDGGIQKYLDGYEISPHPDIRRKAATYMININPGIQSEELDIHTHYMKFTKSREYVRIFWEGNEDYDRTWVPWDWAETVKRQTKNNSIVLFAPSNETLHAVKAAYDHLTMQRTQVYGNLWHIEDKKQITMQWQDLNITTSKLPSNEETAVNNFAKFRDSLYQSMPNFLKRRSVKATNRPIDVGKRNI